MTCILSKSPLRGRCRFAATFKFARQLLTTLRYLLLPYSRADEFIELPTPWFVDHYSDSYYLTLPKSWLRRRSH